MTGIYISFPPIEVVVTTTPYPVEATESMQLSASVSSGYMNLINTEDIECSADVIAGTYVQTRWFYEDGPYDDSVECSADVIDGTNIQERWWVEDGPYDDSVECSADVISASNVNKRVEADSPDEMLQLTCTILDTCSMTAI